MSFDPFDFSSKSSLSKQGAPLRSRIQGLVFGVDENMAVKASSKCRTVAPRHVHAGWAG
jgi:hypothetical protein